MVLKKLPVGISDFREIIEKNYYYVDKSLLIKDIIEDGSKAILIPRPRRFGKTLNISMLKYFFRKSDEDFSYLFKALAIWNSGEEYINMQGKYPVIFFTFKDIKSLNWDMCLQHLKILISDEYRRHDYLLKSELLNDIEKKLFLNIMAQNCDTPYYEVSIRRLSEYLSKYHNKKVIILIDEYDTPIQSGYMEGYYKDIIGFMKNLLSAALKDNIYLEKGVLTGILRVAKESIFTGLNNFEVYSILKDEFSSYFGLLENEVCNMLEYYGIKFEINDVKKWYNGYIFGKNTIYNPWSIINFIDEPEEGLIPHWINTSGNDLIKKLIIMGDSDIKNDIEKLIRGESIKKSIDENIVFEDLDRNNNAIWGFLLFTGYLKAISNQFSNKHFICELKIPNNEVEVFYEDTIIEWFKRSTTSIKMREMLEGLIEGDMQVFEYHLKRFVINTMSYFDPTGEEPERVYQGFVLGILLNLTDNYYVKSNRESGLGRYDLAIIPKDKNKKAIIMEFKKVSEAKKETLQSALDIAMAQIETKKYDNDIKEAGISTANIIKVGIAFKDKELMMRY